MKKVALLIIDMQNDFVQEEGVLEIEDIRDGIKRFKEFIDSCRKKGITIIYTRHCFSLKDNPVEAKLFPELEKEGLRKGTEGWKIYDEIKPEKDDVVVDKTRYDAFFKTRLNDILKSNDIDTVIITGTMTNVCCESTARSAMFNNYNVWFCSGLTFTSDPEAHKNTLKNMSTHFGKVMSSKEIIEALE